MNVKDLWESDPGFITKVSPIDGDDIMSGSGDITDPTFSAWVIKGVGGEVTLSDGNKLIVDAAGNIVG